MKRALTVELLKMRRSPVVWTTTLLIVVLAPLLCLGFIAAADGGAGALGAKAEAMVSGEGWEAYLGLLGQMVAVTLFIGPGVVTAWAFGREHSEHTFASLFALPVSRRSIAAAKFVVLIVWGIALTAAVLVAAVIVGLIADVGSLEGFDLVGDLARLAIAGMLTTTIASTIGLVASIGRGYLPAIGAIIMLTMFAQIAVLVGTGGWFPFAAPGLYAVAGAEGVAEVNAVQLLMVPVTTGVAAWATLRWWQHAEV
jgi:ABC-2 type transport system permease protein